LGLGDSFAFSFASLSRVPSAGNCFGAAHQPTKHGAVSQGQSVGAGAGGGGGSGNAGACGVGAAVFGGDLAAASEANGKKKRAVPGNKSATGGSSGVGAGGAGSLGKAGRPKRDLSLTAEQTISDFCAVVQGTSEFQLWFGEEYKTNRRSLARLMEDMGSKINATQDRNEFDVLTKLKNKLQAIVTVADFLRRRGIDDLGLASTMDAQIHFLSMAPQAEIAWPDYLLSNKLSQQIRACENPDQFWKAIVSQFAGVAPGDLVKKQATVIAERIIGITKGDDMLQNLKAFFPKGLNPQVDKSLSEQICDVSTLAWCGEDTCPEQVRSVRQCLWQAVVATRLPENEITNALTIFPAGRLVITRASELESKYAAMADAMEHAAAFIGKATSALESARRSFRACGSRIVWGTPITQAPR
jgi:hypothetical protein